MTLTQVEKIELLKRLADDRGFEFRETYEGRNGYSGPAIIVPDVFEAVAAGNAFAKFRIKVQVDDMGKRQKVIYF